MPFHARLRVSAIAALSVVTLVACAPGALDVEQEADGAPPTPSASSEASQPEASEAPETVAIDTSDWLEYSTHDGDVSFRHPADWALASDAEQNANDTSGRWYDQATLTAPNGQALLQAGDFVDIGGACGEGYAFPVEVLASERAVGSEGVSIVTVALGTEDGRWTFGTGLTADDAVAGPTACSWYFAHGSSDGGVSIGTRSMIASAQIDPLWTVDTLDDARAYMETAEYATLLEILRSVRTA